MTHRFKSEARGFSAIHLSQPDDPKDKTRVCECGVTFYVGLGAKRCNDCTGRTTDDCDDCPTAACGACDGPPACERCEDRGTVCDPLGCDPATGIWDVIDCPDCEVD